MFENRYSRLDRALHGLAFGGLGLQKAVADVEVTLYGKAFAAVDASRPVFVTSLPRAGTTLLLEILHGVPGFATHTYRDMPFVLAPLLWDRLSKGFRATGEARERAHGDGMAVGYDSPEAFEEVIWKSFWAGKYNPGWIETWSAEDRDEEFETFLRQHVQKIILLRAGPGGRYVSKNNANVARVGLLPEIFPGAAIVVPFRDPVDHAGSLLRQHLNFVGMHAEDPFSLRYMESIGHHDFGRALRPIDFGGWRSAPAGDPVGPDAAEFWTRYWVAAFEHLIERRPPALRFFDYDAACEAPGPRLEALEGALELAAGALAPAAARFRPPNRHAGGVAAGVPPSPAARRAGEVFAELRRLAVA